MMPFFHENCFVADIILLDEDIENIMIACTMKSIERMYLGMRVQ